MNESKQQESKLSRWGMVGATVAAVFASTCCTVPLALMAFGVSGAAFASIFEPYRHVFLAIAGLFLIAAFYVTYRPQRCESESCASKESKTSVQRMNRVMLWIVAVVVLLLGTFPNYIGALLDSDGQSNAETTPISAEAVPVHISVQGMTCEGCASGLQSELANLPGIERAIVDYEGASATVYRLPDGPSDERLAKAVHDAGYTATTIQVKELEIK